MTILKKYLTLLRPHQWLKNLLLFFPPFFGGKIADSSVIASMLPAFLSFSFIASCGYILNDIKDRDLDRYHATKKDRPIVRGDVRVVTALIIAFICYVAAMLISSSVSQRFEGILIIYFFISLLYTLYFKNMVIIDIFFISFGFLIRVLAGGEAFHITVSSWLFLTVFVVSLFLATGKRLGEVLTLGIDASKHRSILAKYSPSFLEGMMWFSASAAIIMYALYTIENKGELIYTVPIAVFGLLRYIYVVKDGRSDPTEALLKDGPILGAGIVWALIVGAIVYGKV